MIAYSHSLLPLASAFLLSIVLMILFLFQPFQIADVSYCVIGTYLYFFFFREEEIFVRKTVLSLSLDGCAKQ